MPLKRCDGGWKWGDAGKCYPSKGDAVKQGLAIGDGKLKESFIDLLTGVEDDVQLESLTTDLDQFLNEAGKKVPVGLPYSGSLHVVDPDGAHPFMAKKGSESKCALCGKGLGHDGHWQDAPSYMESMVEGDLEPLLESALNANGEGEVKIIRPGWGSSGYYSSQLLREDGPGVFVKGTKMYWDHPTASEAKERPERSLRDLAAELTGNAVWRSNGKKGPGLYAPMKVFEGYRQAVGDLAPHIGVSIRAMGKSSQGTAEGRSGRIIEKLHSAQSVDFVTQAGAGGQVLQLFESARSGQFIPQEVVPVGLEDDLREARAALAQVTKERDDARTEAARFRESNLLESGRKMIVGALAEKTCTLPDITKARLLESLKGSVVLTESGTLDEAAMREKIAKAIKDEADYIATLTRSGRPRGNGTVTEAVVDPTAELTEAFKDLDWSENIAKAAARGRD